MRAPEFYRDRRGRWRWQMRDQQGHVIARGGRDYRRRASAERGASVAANRLALWGVRGML